MATCKIAKHEVSPTYSYIFDTNVWIYIFAPIAGVKPHKQKEYSQLLKDIRSREATIWISSLIVSEYVNAVLRIAFKQWMHSNKLYTADFKHDFRPTAEYKAALSDAKLQVNAILGICERRPDDFNHIDVGNIIASMNTTSYDFGDAMIANVCERNKEIHLVTDDTDITMAEVPFNVITA
ncbi:MAG: PIN domain-containing protein [Prevotella sp.]|nr:PIN domain-containing protein [Prevotella sp.]